MNSLKPFGRRIQVKPEKSSSVIETADTNLVERAVVVAIGDKVETIREGMTVVFTSFGVDSIDLDGERHYFILEEDAFILAYSHEV